MKLTLNQVLSICSTIHQLHSQIMPFNVSFKFTKIYSILQTDYTAYLHQIEQLVKTYAEYDEAGQMVVSTDGMGIKIKEEYVDKAHQVLKELGELETNDLDLIYFAPSELEELNLSIDQINSLKILIKEEAS